MFYIVTRSLSQGKSSGLASVAGVALGNFGNAVGASVGLAAVFAVSSIAFSIVKYAGAAYLIYLGVRTIFVAGPAKVVSGPATGAALAVNPDCNRLPGENAATPAGSTGRTSVFAV